MYACVRIKLCSTPPPLYAHMFFLFVASGLKASDSQLERGKVIPPSEHRTTIAKTIIPWSLASLAGRNTEILWNTPLWDILFKTVQASREGNVLSLCRIEFSSRLLCWRLTKTSNSKEVNPLQQTCAVYVYVYVSVSVYVYVCTPTLLPSLSKLTHLYIITLTLTLHSRAPKHTPSGLSEPTNHHQLRAGSGLSPCRLGSAEQVSVCVCLARTFWVLDSRCQKTEADKAFLEGIRYH